jgi:hypothetical protein
VIAVDDDEALRRPQPFDHLRQIGERKSGSEQNLAHVDEIGRRLARGCNEPLSETRERLGRNGVQRDESILGKPLGLPAKGMKFAVRGQHARGPLGRAA